MKKILFLAFLLIGYLQSQSQTYDPSKATTSNKPYGQAQYGPTDARAYKYDAPNFVWRPYVDTNEVLSYLNLSKYRSGQVLYVVNTGGTLLNGVITGGTNELWYFKDGQANANLVRLVTSSGGGSLTNFTFQNTAGIVGTVTNPTTTPILSLSLTASGGDVVGTWPILTAATFNGLPPSYYLNYNNLTNLPTIPAQLNPACVGCTISGVYPNLTWTVTGGGGSMTAGTYITLTGGGTVINLDTLNDRKVDTLIGVNDSTLNFVLNGVSHTISLRGGAHGGGGGTGSVTNFSFTNANGVNGVVTNPTSTPNLTITLTNITPTTVNGLTFASIANAFTITGGTGSPKTLTVNGTGTLSGNNSGDVTVTGETYGTIAAQLITFHPVDVSGTNITGVLKASAEPAHVGDVTNSAGNLTLTIATSAVTYAKMQNETGQTFLGRYDASAGVVQEGTFAPYIAFNTTTGLVTLNGIASVATSDLIYGAAANQFATLARNLTNQRVLTNSAGSGVPSWGQLDLAFGATGVLAIINGGNGTSSPVLNVGIGLTRSGTWNNYTIALDTANLHDTLHLQNVGPGMPIGYTNNSNTLYLETVIGGTNITVTKNADSSWTISGAGATSVDVNQVHTAGATVTVSNGTNIMYVDPASVLAALTITLPVTPHNSNLLWIHFGGTITSGGAVVTALTIAANGGQTLVQIAAPTTANAGNNIIYRWRAATSTWYRVN